MARKKDLPKILVVGDAVVPTGFARVIQGVFQYLTDDYEVHQLGINYQGDPHGLDWSIYPAFTGGDVYGLGRFESLMKSIKPDIVFILNDIWIHAEYRRVLEQFLEEKDFKVVLYSPVDAGPIDYKWIKELTYADRFCVYTEYAKGVIQDSIDFIRNVKGEEFDFPEIEVIPHGVNADIFYPLDDLVDRAGKVIVPAKVRAKKELYPDEEEFMDSFVVLNANRNQPRKRIDVTMKGFALFAKDKPKNVKLYLHMGIEDVGWNIISLAERFGIDDRLIISSTSHGIPGVSDERLNLIYNGTDVGINTSIGEGWGLVPFEHAATRTAQIVPRHSAHEEIWDGAAEFMEPSYYMTNERVLTEGAYVTPDSVADAIQKVYDDPDYLEELSIAAYEVTKKEEYQWENIAQKFNTIFQEVLNE